MLTDKQLRGALAAMRSRHAQGEGDDDEAVVVAGAIYLEQKHGIGGDDAFRWIREAMDQRAELLRTFGLQDRATFEANPAKLDGDVWRVSVSARGDPAVLMSHGQASRLSDVIRRVDPVLADQLEAAMEKVRRYGIEKP